MELDWRISFIYTLRGGRRAWRRLDWCLAGRGRILGVFVACIMDFSCTCGLNGPLQHDTSGPESEFQGLLVLKRASNSAKGGSNVYPAVISSYSCSRLSSTQPPATTSTKPTSFLHAMSVMTRTTEKSGRTTSNSLGEVPTYPLPFPNLTSYIGNHNVERTANN